MKRQRMYFKDYFKLLKKEILSSQFHNMKKKSLFYENYLPSSPSYLIPIYLKNDQLLMHLTLEQLCVYIQV